MNSHGEVVVHTCSCGHKHRISEREIALYKGMVESLLRVFNWCKKNNRHEFKRKDIAHLLANHNESSRFGDWLMFGGLMYRPEGQRKGGYFGLNMERTDDFFGGKYKIPKSVWKNPITGEIRQGDDVTIHEIPNLGSLLEDGEYVANYRATGDIIEI